MLLSPATDICCFIRHLPGAYCQAATLCHFVYAAYFSRYAAMPEPPCCRDMRHSADMLRRAYAAMPLRRYGAAMMRPADMFDIFRAHFRTIICLLCSGAPDYRWLRCALRYRFIYGRHAMFDAADLLFMPDVYAPVAIERDACLLFARCRDAMQRYYYAMLAPLLPVAYAFAYSASVFLLIIISQHAAMRVDYSSSADDCCYTLIFRLLMTVLLRSRYCFFFFCRASAAAPVIYPAMMFFSCSPRAAPCAHARAIMSLNAPPWGRRPLFEWLFLRYYLRHILLLLCAERAPSSMPLIARCLLICAAYLPSIRCAHL